MPLPLLHHFLFRLLSPTNVAPSTGLVVLLGFPTGSPWGDLLSYADKKTHAETNPKMRTSPAITKARCMPERNVDANYRYGVPSCSSVRPLGYRRLREDQETWFFHVSWSSWYIGWMRERPWRSFSRILPGSWIPLLPGGWPANSNRAQ